MSEGFNINNLAPRESIISKASRTEGSKALNWDKTQFFLTANYCDLLRSKAYFAEQSFVKFHKFLCKFCEKRPQRSFALPSILQIVRVAGSARRNAEQLCTILKLTDRDNVRAESRDSHKTQR
jgi:hypothetical protein